MKRCSFSVKVLVTPVIGRILAMKTLHATSLSELLLQSFSFSFLKNCCLGSKRKRVSDDLNLPIDPSISTMYSTLHFLPQHLILMTCTVDALCTKIVAKTGAPTSAGPCPGGCNKFLTKVRMRVSSERRAKSAVPFGVKNVILLGET